MNLFEIVKQGVSCREAAEHYGVDVKYNAMARCPFHPDKNPSLYVANDHFYCFGCGEHGDVIDFTAKHFGISGKNAAKKLARDFGLTPNPLSSGALFLSGLQGMSQWELERRCTTALKKRVDILTEWKRCYAPKVPGEGYDPRFLESCWELPKLEQMLDTMLTGSNVDRQIIAEYLLHEGRLFRKEVA